MSLAIDEIQGKVPQYSLERILGRGSWTEVIFGQRKTDGSLWALKFLDPDAVAKTQTQERELDIEEIWKKESLGGNNTAYTNIANNFVDETSDGTKFLAEEYIDQFLSDYLEGCSLRLEEILQIGEGLADGLDVFHRELGRAHGDLKPENIGYTTKGIIKLSDFGASTVLKPSDKIRDNIGTILIRAPEIFKKGSHPTERSDVWSFGSLMYKMFTDKYIFERELRNAVDPVKYMQDLDIGVGNLMIKRKLQEIPKPFRKFLYKCLDMHAHERYDNGSVLKNELERTIKNMGVFAKFKKIAIPVLAVGGLFGVLAVASFYKAPPAGKDMPSILEKRYASNIAVNFKKLEGLEFEVEDSSKFGDGFVTRPHDIGASSLTNNKYVYNLYLAYRQACEDMGFDSRKDMLSGHQLGIVVTYYNPVVDSLKVKIIGSIELAMMRSQTPSGKVDLEDVCAISRLGIDTVAKARRAVGSFDFKDYVGAKDNAGNYIIPEKEQKFLQTWMTYIK